MKRFDIDPGRDGYMEESDCGVYVEWKDHEEVADELATTRKVLSREARHRESVEAERDAYRAALEGLIQTINNNLGTHDHTDWGLESAAETAEAVLRG